MLDFEVGDASELTSLKLFERIYKHYKVEIICTDANPVYQSLMKYYTPTYNTKHYVTKAETSLVESWNMRLRHYLARLKRKTICYSKSLQALKTAITLLIHKEISLSVYA